MKIHKCGIFSSKVFHICIYRQTLSTRGSSDSDKLTPANISTSRGGAFLLESRTRHDQAQLDEDDNLLDVVGPSQSPLLPLDHPMQLPTHPNTGEKS